MLMESLFSCFGSPMAYFHSISQLIRFARVCSFVEAIRRSSTNLSRLMSDLSSFFVFKALFTEFRNCACAKRLLCLSEFVILVLH